MIARTELAAPYNGGHYLSVLQAQQQGLMGECKRIWRTADTERTCSYCAALDGTEVGMEEDFIFTHGRQTTSVTTPPARRFAGFFFTKTKKTGKQPPGGCLPVSFFFRPLSASSNR